VRWAQNLELARIVAAAVVAVAAEADPDADAEADGNNDADNDADNDPGRGLVACGSARAELARHRAANLPHSESRPANFEFVTC
jgi:hypothetical protein